MLINYFSYTYKLYNVFYIFYIFIININVGRNLFNKIALIFFFFFNILLIIIILISYYINININILIWNDFNNYLYCLYFSRVYKVEFLVKIFKAKIQVKHTMCQAEQIYLLCMELYFTIN